MPLSSDEDLVDGLSARTEDIYFLTGLGLDGIENSDALDIDVAAVDTAGDEELLLCGVGPALELDRCSLTDLSIYLSALSATSFL